MHWMPAVSARAQGETIRQTAERALAEAIEEEDVGAMRAYFVGNAPAGHFSASGGLGGVEEGPGSVFFHRAHLVSYEPPASPRLRGRCKGGAVAWVGREEIAGYVGSEEAKIFLRKLLID